MKINIQNQIWNKYKKQIPNYGICFLLILIKNTKKYLQKILIYDILYT
jgi:hypothetical protein